ncbi:hypothetical protein NPX13_g7365 [Xylaria arbuscula]|uniref:Clr5 domain-containing protein n=1 Tax=Xylaria arbuscula TaxID=114810 RepID=A0A9W8NAT6_9PEZI|nr:hypothetical protein NPX13_g7365 [Xylaria arbuscula]
MASSPSQQRATSNNIWTQNALLIKQLYIIKDLPLREVRRILQKNHGFPAFSMKLYEKKIKQLGLRKNLPKSDWAIVKAHLDARGDKASAVYVCGVRRSKKTINTGIAQLKGSLTDNAQLYPLPEYLEVRTPSPPPGNDRHHTSSSPIDVEPRDHRQPED